MIEALRARVGVAPLRLVGNGLLYSLGGLLSQALSVLLLPIFTRYLSPHDYGILAYTAVLASVLTLLGSLAIQSYIIRYHHECRTDREIRRFYGTAVMFVCGYNVLLLAVAFVSLPALFRLLGLQVPFYPYVQLTLICTAIEIVGLIPLSYFRAKEQAGAYVGLALAMAFLNGGLSLYLVAGREMGLVGRYYGQLGADVILLVVYGVVLARIADVAWDGRHVRIAMAYCLPLVPAQFLASFTSFWDRLILERFVPLSDLGLYTVGMGLACAGTVLTTGMYTAVQPRICQMASQGRLEAGILAYKRNFLLMVMGLIALSVALSRDIVSLLTSESFHESYKIAALLSVAILMQAYLTNIPSLYLMAIEKTKYETPIRLAGTLAGVTAMFLMVPWMGIYGAAAASIATALFAWAGYYWALKRESSIQWDFSRDLMLIGAAGLAGYLILQIEMSSLWLSAGAKVVAFSAMAGLYLWRVGDSAGILVPGLRPSRVPETP